jgi:hypothetical protein
MNSETHNTLTFILSFFHTIIGLVDPFLTPLLIQHNMMEVTTSFTTLAGTIVLKNSTLLANSPTSIS